MHYFGAGFPPNSLKAIEYMNKSSEMGNADADFQLGTIYLKGDKVKKEDSKAIEYWTRASNKGHYSAKDHLKRIFNK